MAATPQEIRNLPRCEFCRSWANLQQFILQKEADPELEALLAEEEEIAKRTRNINRALCQHYDIINHETDTEWYTWCLQCNTKISNFPKPFDAPDKDQVRHCHVHSNSEEHVNPHETVPFWGGPFQTDLTYLAREI